MRMKIRKKSACGRWMQIRLFDILCLYLGAAVVVADAAVGTLENDGDDCGSVVDFDNLDDSDDLRGAYLTFEESAAD
jgi:hypothetical protein